ncbi:MAG: hemolysin family protein [Lachnospiraceae bacterium]|nr:hemolysin family protein [Lachnospiraceae bacterium]
MDVELVIKIIILLILLVLSAFFSSAETALTTVNLMKMRSLAEEGSKSAAKVLKVTDNRPKMLSAILIGNNIVNISASSLATMIAVSIWGSYGAGIATGVLTLLILIFGEITPKTMATIQANRVSMRFAGIIWVLMVVLTPIIYIVNLLSSGVMRIFGIDPKKTDDAMTEEELRTIVDVSHESGVTTKGERKIIHNLFDFSDATAKEIMIPRIDMTMANVNWSYDRLMEGYCEHKYTRIPVYENEVDNIIGFINMKDFLIDENRENFKMRDFLRKAHFTYERKNTAELFDEMRSNSFGITIVIDEFGAVAGMITLEDLLEELVGEIRDEFDTYEEDDVIKTGDNEYDVLGSANLEDLCDEIPLGVSSEDYDTIGGYVVGEFDHFPNLDETIITEDFHQITVTGVEKNRVTKVHIKLNIPPEENEESEENA